jgi:predicted nucleotidyltransferase
MDNLLKMIQTLGKNLNNEIPIRQLSAESSQPYTSTHRLVEKNSQIFSINKKGNIKLVSLNRTDSIVKNYLIIAERKETESFISKDPRFKVLQDSIPKGDYSLILFGSRAERKNREKSDVDLCIISKQTPILKLDKFKLLYRLNTNPIFFKDTEFIQMLNERDQNLAKEILKKHIILYGEEYFWNLVWHVI